MMTDDKSAAAAFMAGRRLGEGSAAGTRNYVIDRIGEIIEAGAQEIMIGGLATDDIENFQRFDEEVIRVFQ
jgi:alkanesulfonate monooxygenase SsuD/methylene tetrahydromethanopterin reductase-like flavin-dependent oxidoreductase (luciferase family)